MKRLTAPSRGFTLLEVLVSIFLMAVLSGLAFEALNYVRRSREVTRDVYARLGAIELTVHLLSSDFAQLAPRPVRDVVGTAYVPALLADSRTTNLVTLTRGGWMNTAGLPRSTYQRVTWRLADGTLVRDHSTVLDATLSNVPMQREMLTDIVSIRLRYMDAQRNWQETWPALSTVAGNSAAQLGTRPRAVEITLELKDLGIIRRLIEVPG
ncbi:MAG: type II secretion system minor pseudopilin GspJ [Pseudomonadota bacterium]|jgi:general secretion pathway protein J